MATTQFNGKQVEMIPVDFEEVKEPFCEYVLATGKDIKYRGTLVELYVLVGEVNPQTGGPLYYVMTKQNIDPPTAGMRVSPIEFHPRGEPWSEYSLSDGKKLKIRVTASKIFKVEGDESGEPILAIIPNVVTRVI
jgi:hypothetical protein